MTTTCDYICESKLIQERGWTMSLIKKYLGNPDKLARNPHYSSAPSMKLYQLERVMAIEQLSEVQQAKSKILEQRKRRRKAMAQVIQKKREQLYEYIQSLPIKIPKMSTSVLYKRALEHYNRLWVDQRNRIDKLVSEDPQQHNEQFLARIAVNMLRHEHTEYEYELQYNLFRKIGKQEAISLLKQRILSVIRQTYHDVEAIVNECERQLKE